MTKVLTGKATYKIHRGENINNPTLTIPAVRKVSVGPTGFATFEHEDGTTTGVYMQPGWYYDAIPHTVESKFEVGDTVEFDQGEYRGVRTSKIVRIQKATNYHGEVEYMVGTKTSSMGMFESELSKVVPVTD